MSDFTPPAVVGAPHGDLLPVLRADSDAVGYFAGIADLDATDPASHELEDGVELASGARLEQFARAGSGDAFCFVGEGGEERPVVYVSLDGEAGLVALGLPELVTLCLVAPWWQEGRELTGEELRAVADEYRQSVPDFDLRRERAMRALGLEAADLPSEAEALARLMEVSRGPEAKGFVVTGADGDPLAALVAAPADRT
ncbi:hypothetical protein ABZY90_00345 [Streptomyces sp. NPDC006422]|uniref:hypothetical protein n=1 Tax=unclassified Streptomyces TaxID=2593676 RepID=UPI00339E2BAF